MSIVKLDHPHTSTEPSDNHISGHIVSHTRHPGLRSDNTLHVIGVCSNPPRFQSRYRLTRQWYDDMCKTTCVAPYLVEGAFGDRHHEVTTGQPDHLQVRLHSEIWVKENLINLGVRRLLPRDWRYLAWVDTDVTFRDPNWAQETLHQLQHWHVVQPWQQCSDLGFHGNIVQTFQSFGFLNQRGVKIQAHKDEPYIYGHSGFAWACTREFYEQVMGLTDFCILGSADHHMAWAMAGDVDKSIHRKMQPSFFRRLHEWQFRAMRMTHGQVGFTNGRIEHAFHGAKKNRKYRERWQILVDHHFDPDKDLMYDGQGVIQLVGKPALEQAVRLYNRARHEDSIDGE
jgi:hypothetical protein